uniref:ZP domain-containing protein n=1 Tax=Panagrolaimus sp. JU765 TaxID=591449 RepID=A0AC34Q9A4_9BILA
MTFVVFFILFLWLKFTYSLSVTVSCSVKQIDLLFIFDDPFYGMISMKPKDSCFVKGDGHPKLLLTLALGNGTGQKCSVIQREGFNLAVIDVNVHSELQTNDDISYLIRCPIMNPHEKIQKTNKIEMPPGATLEIVDKSVMQKKQPAIVGKPYDLKLVLPSNLEFDIKIGQCIAFTTENEFAFLPLTDEVGWLSIEQESNS